MNQHEKINYLEFPAKDLKATKDFFQKLFGWEFVDYGHEYVAFSAKDTGIDGGFYKSDQCMRADQGSALVVFYSAQLEQTLNEVVSAGGEITAPTFSFPGGRRFHFSDPNGNEYAVWSE